MDIFTRNKKIGVILDELFPMPPEADRMGSGIYLATIQEGLAKWNAIDPEDETCPQEFQVLWAIKDLLDVWDENQQEDE